MKPKTKIIYEERKDIEHEVDPKIVTENTPSQILEEDLISILSITKLGLKTFRDYYEDNQIIILEELNNYDASKCLMRHNITQKGRFTMINWFLEIKNCLKFPMATFFKAVGIMDLYFKNCRR